MRRKGQKGKKLKLHSVYTERERKKKRKEERGQTNGDKDRFSRQPCIANAFDQ